VSSIRVFGVVLCAIAVAMSLAAAPAVADESVTLCKANEEFCIAPSLAGEAFTASGEASFEFGELGTVECASSMTRTEAIQISTLSFTGCSEGCSVKANNLPYTGSLESPSAGSGKMKLLATVVGEIQIAVACGALECVYGSSTGTVDLTFSAGMPASIGVEKSLALKTKSFFCPKEITWDGIYEFTSPTFAVYMTTRKIEGNVLCGINEEICPQESIRGTLRALLKSGSTYTISKLVGGSLTCKASEFRLAKKLYKAEEPWHFQKFFVKGCSNPTYTGCVVNTFPEIIYNTQLLPASGGDGEIVVGGLGGKEPALGIECTSGKTPFACTYAAEEMGLEFEGGEPATIQQLSSMTRVEGSKTFCPSSVVIQAESEVVETGTPELSLFMAGS
jgi:hypothetical protein